MLDQLSRRVFRNSVEIKLTKQEFLLLEFLMRHKDQVFNSEALVERAWSSLSESSPDTVRAHMAQLTPQAQRLTAPRCQSNLA